MPDRPLHLLVTAGPTREKIDAVRDWGNIFSGQTGLELALAFLDLGNVTLLTSNLSHAQQYDGYSGKAGMLGIETFRSHGDLSALLAERMTAADAPVHAAAMTAAVADYTPAGVYRITQRRPDPDNPTRETWSVENVAQKQIGAGKIKSTHDAIAIHATRTLKLIDQFRTAWHFTGLLIKFKLEVGLSDDDLISVAAASRLASAADLIVANTLAMARPAAGDGAAYLIDAAQTQRINRLELPSRITHWIQAHLR